MASVAVNNIPKSGRHTLPHLRACSNITYATEGVWAKRDVTHKIRVEKGVLRDASVTRGPPRQEAEFVFPR